MKALLMTLALVGCGQQMQQIGVVPEGRWSRDLGGYVDQFRQDARDRHVDPNHAELVQLEWADLSHENENGQCRHQTRFGVRYAYVRIDNAMKTEPAALVRLVVYHELAHCLLGANHVDNAHDIMFWQSPSAAARADYEAATDKAGWWTGLVDELFTANGGHT